MLDPLTSIFIEGRAWFDRSGGNTYHSVRIWVNGRTIAQLGMTYGGETQYIYTATTWLIANGYLPAEAIGWPIHRITREFGIVIYATVSEVKKRDLFTPTVKEYINA